MCVRAKWTSLTTRWRAVFCYYHLRHCLQLDLTAVAIVRNVICTELFNTFKKWPYECCVRPELWQIHFEI